MKQALSLPPLCRQKMAGGSSVWLPYSISFHPSVETIIKHRLCVYLVVHMFVILMDIIYHRNIFQIIFAHGVVLLFFVIAGLSAMCLAVN